VKLSLASPPDVGAPELVFLESDFDPENLESLDEAAQRLIDRDIDSTPSLETYLHDWSELASRVDGEVARRYIAMTCDTRDEDVKQRYISFERDVVSRFRTLEDALNRKYLESPHRGSLDDQYAVFDLRRARAAEIFREENVAIQARDRELTTRWEGIQGAVTVEFRGKTRTPQQCAIFMEETDRATREDAFLVIARRRLEDRDEIDDIFDELLDLRGQIAANAGFENYRDYRFAELCRFDYTPADCEGFHEAVELEVLPALKKLAEERKDALGIDTLRQWDRFVGLSSREPLRPFTTVEEYIDVTRRVFRAVDPVFEKDFEILERNGLLDLMSRPGKAPGGYNYPVEDVRMPFIFFNAVGTHSDIQTLLHEGGHAFHTLATRDERLRDYREAPMEFCEVASMAMELFGLERIDSVYTDCDAREAKRNQLRSTVEDFSWFATIDAFQHWLYTNPGHGRDARREAWIDIYTRFQPFVDWTGREEIRDWMWQKQGHLFGSPFYYIEYAIAQIGALQAWINDRKDHVATVAAYRKSLRLGGSRRLPQLFETAGLRFAMDREMLGKLIPRVMARIEELEG
jgi:oligoendopeptidase F